MNSHQGSSLSTEFHPWGNLGFTAGIHLLGPALFAAGVWVTVLMDWMRVLSAGGFLLSILLLLAGALLYLLSFPALLGATVTALLKREWLAGFVTLLVTAAAFVEGYRVAGYTLAHGLKGPIAFFGGSGLRF
jgi:hypothetical protein